MTVLDTPYVEESGAPTTTDLRRLQTSSTSVHDDWANLPTPMPGAGVRTSVNDSSRCSCSDPLPIRSSDPDCSSSGCDADGPPLLVKHYYPTGATRPPSPPSPPFLRASWTMHPLRPRSL